MGKRKGDTDLSTEEKIKEAARIVFTKKGYSATRTRDIAEEAGINLALLNYYFRSKEKLFEIVILEKMHLLLGRIGPILTDEKSDIQQKVTLITDHYIDTLLENPDIPLFVMGEIRYNPEKFAGLINSRIKLVDSAFYRQLRARCPHINPLHFILNLLGLLIFPFIAKPLLRIVTGAEPSVMAELMTERKQLVKIWFKALLEAS